MLWTEESTAQPIPQPQEEAVHHAQAEEPSVVRTEVPAAHVSHSTRAFVVEGVRWYGRGPRGPDMGGGGTQGESSGSPDERPAGCVGPANTEHGPASTGDDGNDGEGGIAGEGTLGVARATGHPKTSVSATNFDARIDAPAAAVHAAGIGAGGRRLARDRQERVAGGNRGGTRGRDGTAEGWQALRPGQRRRTTVPGEARSRGHPGVRFVGIDETIYNTTQYNKF